MHTHKSQANSQPSSLSEYKCLQMQSERMQMFANAV
jgi:hypothetical protein